MPLTASTACAFCPPNSSSIEGSALLTDCTCNPGWTGPNGTECTPCLPGFFKLQSGPMACDICDRGTYSGRAQSSCTLCPANTYINTIGATSCLNCPPAPASGVSTWSGLGSANASLYCTLDILTVEGAYLVDSNLSSFLAKRDAYRQGIAEIVGSHSESVIITSWSEIVYTQNVSNASKSMRRLLSHSAAHLSYNRTKMTFQFTVPRYWKDYSRKALFDFGHDLWAVQRGLSTATLINASYHENCGAGRQPDPMYPSLMSEWNARFDGLAFPYTVNGTNFTPPAQCNLCPEGKYKNLSDDTPCVGCFPYSSTALPGALQLLQCECLPGYYSNGLLSVNHSCSICGEGYYCPGAQARFPCSPGTYTRPGIINYSSSCTLCDAMTYKPNWGNGSCIPCPNRTESGVGSATCPCRAGFVGPDLGPCLCKTTSNRYLIVTLEGQSGVFESKSVTLRVYNTSSGSSMLCGARGVYCEPFHVFYTLDGRTPNKTSASLACQGWRADLCAKQWGTGYEVKVLGSNLVRAVVLKQGFHEDVCAEYGEEVPQDSNLAAWSCNTPVQQVHQRIDAYPDVPSVELYARNASAKVNASDDAIAWTESSGEAESSGPFCPCSEAQCCSSGELSSGLLGVRVSYPRDSAGAANHLFLTSPYLSSYLISQHVRSSF